MSLDLLQSQIRTLKCPFSLLLCPGIACNMSNERDLEYDFMKAISVTAGILPAVTIKTAAFLSFGSSGAQALGRVINEARSAGLYVIADARLNEIGKTGEMMAEAYLGEGAFASDAVTVDAYLGSEVFYPLLEKCKNFDREIIVLSRMDNRSAGEIMDLISGDRFVYKAVAELAMRNGRKFITECGYSRVMISLGMKHMSDLRMMRKRMEETFFYVTTGVSRQSPYDLAPAFDRYGHGAIVEIVCELDKYNDLSAELIRRRDEFKQVIQIL